MHHAAPSIPPANLGGHVDEAFDFTMHIPIGYVSSILAPFARKDAATGSFLGHGWNGVANERERLCLVEKGASAGAGGKELVKEWRIDDANQRSRCVYESDRNAEHWKEVNVINGSVERVHAPGRAVVDEVVPRCAFGVRFFADKSRNISNVKCPRPWKHHLCEGYLVKICCLMKASISASSQPNAPPREA